MATRLSPAEVQRIRGQQSGGSSASQPGRLTPQQVAQMRGTGAGPTAAPGGMTTRDQEFLGKKNELLSDIAGRDVTRQDVYGALGKSAMDENVKKGEGSGKNGRRTFGEIYGNIGNALSDVGTGVVKSVLRVPTRLGQVANQIAPNAVYSAATQKGSAAAEAFDTAYKGTNAAQKIGATAGDIAQIFVPAGAAGKAVTKGAEAIPFIAKYASQAGNVGRAARLAPKVAGAVAEGVISDAASTGDVDAGTLGFAAGLPVAGAVLQGGRNVLRGAKATAQEAGERVIKNLEEGSASEVGRQAQRRTSFTTALREALGGSRNRAANKAVDQANAKLSYGGKIPSDDDVFGLIHDKAGGLDGVNKDGFFITTKARGALDKDIERYASRARELFASSKDVIDNNKLKANILSVIKSSDDRLGTQENHIKRIFNRNLKDGKLSQPGELLQLSKDLRADAYSAMTQGPKETARAEAYRKAAKKIDEILYERLNDIEPTLAKDLRDEMTRLYTAKDVLMKLENVKAPQAVSGRTASIIGTLTGNIVGGYGLGGLVAGGIGGTVAPKINKALNIAYGKGKVSSEIAQQVSQYMSEKDFKKISDLVDKNISRNTKEKAIKPILDKIRRVVESSKEQIQGMGTGVRELIESPKGLPAPKDTLRLGPAQNLLPETKASRAVADERAGLKKNLKDYLR